MELNLGDGIVYGECRTDRAIIAAIVVEVLLVVLDRSCKACQSACNRKEI